MDVPNHGNNPFNLAQGTGTNLAQLMLAPGTQLQTPLIPPISTARVPDVHTTAPLSQMLLPTTQIRPPPTPPGVMWGPDLTYEGFRNYLTILAEYTRTPDQIRDVPYHPAEISIYNALVERANATNTPYGRAMNNYLDLCIDQNPGDMWFIGTNRQIILGRFKRYLEAQIPITTGPQTPWGPDLTSELFSAYVNRILQYISSNQNLQAVLYDPQEAAVYDAIINRARTANVDRTIILRQLLEFYRTHVVTTNDLLRRGQFQPFMNRLQGYIPDAPFPVDRAALTPIQMVMGPTQIPMAWTPEINIDNFGNYVEAIRGLIRTGLAETPTLASERAIYESIISHADLINIDPTDDLIRFLQLHNRTALNPVSPLDIMTFLQRFRTYIRDRVNYFPIANNNPTFANINPTPVTPFGEVNHILQPTAPPAFSAVQAQTTPERRKASHVFSNLPPALGQATMQLPTLQTNSGFGMLLPTAIPTQTQNNAGAQFTLGTRGPALQPSGFPSAIPQNHPFQIPMVTPSYNVPIVQPLPAVINVSQPVRLISERDIADFENWKIDLQDLLRSEDFKLAPDEKKAKLLLDAVSKTTILRSTFNKIITELWPDKKGDIPQLADDFKSLTYLSRVELEMPDALRKPLTTVLPSNNMSIFTYNRNGPGGEPQVDILADPWYLEIGALIKLSGLWLSQEESFGEDSPLVGALRELGANIRTMWVEVWRAQEVRSRKIPLSEYIATMERWRSELIEIYRIKKRLGRRCRNAVDYIDLTPIEEIPDTSYIRLSNGNCWDVESLLEFIRSKNGENDASDIASYGSPRIWETDADLNRIFNHPKSRELKFRQWYDTRGLTEFAQNISQGTMNALYQTSQILVSRGPYYLQEAQRILGPELWAVFYQYAKGNYYELAKVPRYFYQGSFFNDLPKEVRRQAIEAAMTEIIQADRIDPNDQEAIRTIRRELPESAMLLKLPGDIQIIRRRIYELVRVQLKRDAVNQFWAYFNGLSKLEQDSVVAFRPDFISDMTKCYVGGDGNKGLCVYIWSRVLMRTLNSIEGVKGLPHSELDTGEPAPPDL